MQGTQVRSLVWKDPTSHRATTTKPLWPAACAPPPEKPAHCSEDPAQPRKNKKMSQWCHPTILSPVTPFSSCPQSFPAPGSFPISQLFASGVQSIRDSASASVLLVNIQGWFPLGWTGLISLLSKELSRVFSSTVVLKHQLFGIQPSLWFYSQPYTMAGKTIALTMWTFVSKVMFLFFFFNDQNQIFIFCNCINVIQMCPPLIFQKETCYK